MNLRRLLTSTVFMVCLVLRLPAAAQQTLFEDGPINGTVNAYTINLGFVMSDSLTISGGTSTVTGISFGAWLFPGDTLNSAEVWISSDLQSGTTYFDQQVNFTVSNCFTNNYGYNVCQETASLPPFTLENGTYWLTLQNAESADGNPVYWDENDGVGCHSEGCPSLAGPNDLGTNPPESFSILGTAQTGTGTTPEPASLVLFGSGAIGVLSVLRRKLRQL
jgi:hypothetical protein